MKFANLPLIKVKKFAHGMAIVSKVLMILQIVAISLLALLLAVTLLIPALLPAGFGDVEMGTSVKVSFPIKSILDDGEDFKEALEEASKGLVEGVEIIETEKGFDIALNMAQKMGFAELLASSLIPIILDNLIMVFLFYFLGSFFKSVAYRATSNDLDQLNDETGSFTLKGRKALNSVMVVLIIKCALPLALSFVGVSTDGISASSVILVLGVYFALIVFDYVASLIQRNTLMQQALDKYNSDQQADIDRQ